MMEKTMEPRILLVGKILPIMDILRDELVTNYGRDVVSSASKAHVAEQLASDAFDLLILGAGFTDEIRDDIEVMVKRDGSDIVIYKVPRVGEKNPAKLITIVNEQAVSWKFFKLLGKKPMGPPKGFLKKES